MIHIKQTDKQTNKQANKKKKKQNKGFCFKGTLNEATDFILNWKLIRVFTIFENQELCSEVDTDLSATVTITYRNANHISNISHSYWPGFLHYSSGKLLKINAVKNDQKFFSIIIYDLYFKVMIWTVWRCVKQGGLTKPNLWNGATG